MIYSEEEVAQGKVKIKEMGLREGHPEKEGVMVDMEDLVIEVKQRMKRKATIDSMARQAEGLRVVGGTKGDDAIIEETKSTEPEVEGSAPAGEGNVAPESKVEVIEAVPAS